MADVSDVVLYHAPPSFYSQIARLVLAEKGVAHRRQVVIAGPPLCESYEPWYMRLNPGGTVPTLLVGDDVVNDSRDILVEVDRRFEGPSLVPEAADDRELMEAWVDRGYDLDERTLSYGSGVVTKVGPRINGLRRKALERERAKHPDLDGVYAAKIADIDQFIADTADPQGVAALLQRYDDALDALDQHLNGRQTIVGEQVTLADIVWTVTVARRVMAGTAPFEGRPHLKAWYERMKARPSFKEGDVWEHFRPQVLLGIMARRFKWHLLALTAATLGLGWTAWWLAT